MRTWISLRQLSIKFDWQTEARIASATSKFVAKVVTTHEISLRKSCNAKDSLATANGLYIQLTQNVANLHYDISPKMNIYHLLILCSGKFFLKRGLVAPTNITISFPLLWHFNESYSLTLWVGPVFILGERSASRLLTCAQLSNLAHSSPLSAARYQSIPSSVFNHS